MQVHVCKVLAGESVFKVGLTGSFLHSSGGALDTTVEAREAESLSVNGEGVIAEQKNHC